MHTLSEKSDRTGLEHWLWRSMVVGLITLAVALVSLGIYLYIPFT